MTRSLIALVLALGPAAALATPTLDLSGTEYRGWKGTEVTVYQSDRFAAPRPDAEDARNTQPFNP